MKKLILILIFLILLFSPIIVKAKVLSEEPYQDYKIAGTALWIKNVKVRYVDKMREEYICGEAMGGGGIAYLITLSVSKNCKSDLKLNAMHELLHIYDFQHI